MMNVARINNYENMKEVFFFSIMTFIYSWTLSAQTMWNLKDSLENEIIKMELSKFSTNGYKILEKVPSGPDYIFCTNYKQGRIREFSILNDSRNLNDIIGIYRTYNDSIIEEKLIGLEVISNIFNKLKSLYIGQDINYIRKYLKDNIVYAYDDKSGPSRLILTTKVYHIVLMHDQNIVTRIILTRICD